MSMPRMCAGVLADLVGVVGQLDAAGLAPPAHLDLRLDDDRVADRVGDDDRLVDGVGHAARATPGCRSGRSTACPGTRTGPRPTPVGSFASRVSSSHRQIARSDDPGVNTSATPCAFNVAMSAAGITPPPNTTTSPRSRAFSSSMTRGNSVRWAPDSSDSPDGVDVLLQRRLGDLLGRLVQARVDDLEPGVAQRPGDGLGPSVVAVEAGLGHDHAIGPVHGTRTLRAACCAAPTLSGHTGARGRTPPPLAGGTGRRAGSGRPRRAGGCCSASCGSSPWSSPATPTTPIAASAPTSSRSAGSTAWPTRSSATDRILFPNLIGPAGERPVGLVHDGATDFEGWRVFSLQPSGQHLRLPGPVDREHQGARGLRRS